MYQKLNSIAFCSSLFCLILATYAFYICLQQDLIITSLSSWFFSLVMIILLVIGLSGFRFNETVFSRVKNWLTLLFVFLLILIVVCLHLASYIGGKEHLQTVTSPDEAYTVHIYSWDAGAAGTFGIIAEIDGLLFDKRFYREKRIEEAVVEWIQPHVISINRHKLDLAKGETYEK